MEHERLLLLLLFADITVYVIVYHILDMLYYTASYTVESVRISQKMIVTNTVWDNLTAVMTYSKKTVSKLRNYFLHPVLLCELYNSLIW